MTVSTQESTGPERLNISATDGYSLAARFYRCSSPKGTIIVGSATGVPQGFYRRFAEFASTRGFSVLTFDYRGIGDSAPKTLKGFDMEYKDWGSKDLQGVVDHCKTQSLPLYLVGHSYGGHALGLLDTPNQLSGAYFFGTGAGWHGWMPRTEQLKVQLMWHVIAPVLTRIKGYLGWSILGMGDDLPMGVYRNWKRWCSFPHYFFDDPRQPDMKAKYAKVTIPIKAVTATDDKWAMPASRDAFCQFYSSSQLTRLDLTPQDYSLATIGHMGYFRSAAAELWDDVTRFFEQHASQNA